MPGLHWESFEPGQVFTHAPPHTIVQADNVAFCALTRNTQPLHLDPEWAAKHSPYQKPVVNGILTFALAVGMSVPDLTEGTLVANLGYAEVRHPAPVFPGDTVSAISTVMDKRLTSKPGRGIVRFETRVKNQDGVEVCVFERTVMVKTRNTNLESD